MAQDARRPASAHLFTPSPIPTPARMDTATIRLNSLQSQKIMELRTSIAALEAGVATKMSTSSPSKVFPWMGSATRGTVPLTSGGVWQSPASKSAPLAPSSSSSSNYFLSAAPRPAPLPALISDAPRPEPRSLGMASSAASLVGASSTYPLPQAHLHLEPPRHQHQQQLQPQVVDPRGAQASLGELVGQPTLVGRLESTRATMLRCREEDRVAAEQEALYVAALRAEHESVEGRNRGGGGGGGGGGPERVAALLARLPTVMLQSVEASLISLQACWRGRRGRRVATTLRHARDEKKWAVVRRREAAKAAEEAARRHEMALKCELALGALKASASFPTAAAAAAASQGALSQQQQQVTDPTAPPAPFSPFPRHHHQHSHNHPHNTSIAAGVLSLASPHQHRSLVRDSKVLSSRVLGSLGGSPLHDSATTSESIAAMMAGGGSGSGSGGVAGGATTPIAHAVFKPLPGTWMHSHATIIQRSATVGPSFSASAALAASSSTSSSSTSSSAGPSSGTVTPSHRLFTRTLESARDVEGKGAAAVVEALTARVERAGVPLSKDLRVVGAGARVGEEAGGAGALGLLALQRTMQGEGAATWAASSTRYQQQVCANQHWQQQHTHAHQAHLSAQHQQLLATHPAVSVSLGGGSSAAAADSTCFSSSSPPTMRNYDEVNSPPPPPPQSLQLQFIDSVLDVMQAETADHHDLVVPPEALLPLERLIPHLPTAEGRALEEAAALKATHRRNALEAEYLEKRFGLLGGSSSASSSSASSSSSSVRPLGALLPPSPLDNANSSSSSSSAQQPGVEPTAFLFSSSSSSSYAATPGMTKVRSTQGFGLASFLEAATNSWMDKQNQQQQKQQQKQDNSQQQQQQQQAQLRSRIGSVGSTEAEGGGAGGEEKRGWQIGGMDVSPKSVISNLNEDADVGDSASVVMQRSGGRGRGRY